jgi:hypothetical protein
VTIAEALQKLSLFATTEQPPPDTRMYIEMGMLPRHCEHDVPTLHPCLACKRERAEAA